MMTVRAVLGDLDPSVLGTVDYHEHLFQTSPLLPGDELDDEAASSSEAVSLMRSGFTSMIDATPIGLGRNPEALARISASTGLTVIAATGVHREAHYPEEHWLRQTTVDARARLFIDDLVEGMPRRDGEGRRAESPNGEPVRAGVIKGAVDYWSISRFERTTLEAVAIAHVATGAPVMVHLEFCTGAHEVLDLLSAAGVHENRVVLAHADRDPNAALHLELAARGAWLGYDGMARPRTRSDAELLDLTEAVIAGGAADHLLLGGDVARRSRYLAYGGIPGLAYLGERYLPLLRGRVGDAVVEKILTINSQHYCTWSSIGGFPV
ncbi:MAG: aryldialkylphosphatase [Microbacteriaceae bacterium]|nr:aryldialkylphosphatase [Microbacteriaceae bacterium]